ncbi:MAG TPA: hypothetical protein VLK56_07315 [Solirubrobacterales bacterium]|nr:hypothetical protein [Solirubrobacterales bacterium]
MVRRPRLLPLILLGALSILALPPVAAHAFVFSAPRYAVLEGEGSGPAIFTAGGVEKECKQVHLSGRYFRRTLEIEPVYDGCRAKALAGFPVSYVVNRCVFRLHARAAEAGKRRWKADVDLGCPTTYSMRWQVYEEEKRREGAPSVCDTAMFPQTGVGTAVLSNIAGSPGKIAIDWNLTTIKYKMLYGSILFCGSQPGVVERYASYRDHATIGAMDLGGRPLPLAVRG